jgi:hypothetical protein
MTEELPGETVGYVGVSDGAPIFRKTGDERGDDFLELSVFKTAEDALARYYNVRRVRVVVDPEPVRPPADWGSVD